MTNKHLAITNNKKANNLFLLFMVIGISPLFYILLSYLQNPETTFPNIITASTKDIPSITSAYNPLLTKAMDLYCKTAPAFSLIPYFLTFKMRQPIKNTDRSVVLRSSLLTPLFYAAIVYLFLFRNFELTTAGKPVRLMATNDVTLLLFYIGLYIIIFFATYITLFTPITFLKLIKKRQ